MANRTDSTHQGSGQDRDRLAQAGQILSHLQSQLAELDRREQHLNQQMSALVEQQRATQQSQAAAEKSATELRSEFASREKKLHTSAQEYNQRLAVLENRELQVSISTEKLQAERTAFDRHHRQQQATFEAECQQEQSRQQHDFSVEMNSVREDFDRECQRRKQSLDVEVQEQRVELESQFSKLNDEKSQHRQTANTWAKEKETEKQQLVVDRQARLDQLEADFNNEVAEQRASLKDDRNTLDDQVLAHLLTAEEWEARKELEQKEFETLQVTRLETFEQECAQRLIDFETESREKRELQEAGQLQLDQHQQQHALIVEAWTAQKIEEQKQLADRLSAEREAFDTGIQTEKVAFDDENRKLQKEFAEQIRIERETLLEERRRLREELAKELEEEKVALSEAYQELDVQQREQSRLNDELSVQRTTERAKLLNELEETKKEKLSALDQRETELARREIDFQKRSQLHELHLQRVRTGLNATRITLEKEEQQQQVRKEVVERDIRLRLSHMKRFRDLMTQREDCLAEEQGLFSETRQGIERDLQRKRDQLLEDRDYWMQQRTATTERLRHQEQRLGDEYEALNVSHTRLVELTHELEELVQRASEQQSTQSSQHLNGLLGILGRQRREVEQTLQKLHERLLEIRAEGAELSTWIEERDETVAHREQRYRESVESLNLQEQEFSAARESWNHDRIQAEQVIRELVVQLEVSLDQIARSEQAAVTEFHDNTARHAA